MEDKMIENCQITGLDHNGRGITHINDKIAFVTNALPDEIVDLKKTKENKKIIEAETIEIKKESKERIKAICPYYQECGGCDLMHMKYESQLNFKQNKIKEIMKKYAGLDITIEPIVTSNQPLYYRNKITLQVKNGIIGLYSKKSNDLIPINKCLISDPKINEIISQLKECNLTKTNQIIIRISDQESMVILDQGNIEELKEKLSNVTSIMVNNKCIYGKSHITNKIGNKVFQISPTAFFQVNQNTTEKLYNEIIKKANLNKNESILDLYCGTGTIGIHLSDYVKECFGVEINAQAIEDANENKKKNNVENFKFMSSNVNQIFKRKLPDTDLIIVDPPRSGLDETTTNGLLELEIPKIVYVSCDPFTLARDLKKLQEKYKIKSITPVDMFPNTYHVECVSVLELL